MCLGHGVMGCCLKRGREPFAGITLIAILAAFWACGGGPLSESLPPTRTDDVKEVLHGVEITDPYRWLEDQQSPETRAWIDEQNKHTQSVFEALPGRGPIERRLTELMKIDTNSMPVERSGRYFFSRRMADQDQFVIYMRKGLEGSDTVLVDPHPMSPERTTSVNMLDISEDGSLLAYGVREGGEDEVSVRLMNVDTGEHLPDKLPRARYFGISLKPDKSGFYYTRHNAQGSRVFYHAMGKNPADDTQIFGKGYGPDKGITSSLSEDGRYLLITVFHGSAADQTEIYFQDGARQEPVVPIVNDIVARFSGEIAGSTLFMLTNWNAPRGTILAVNLARPARSNWREVVSERDPVLEDFSLAGGRIFAAYLENVRTRVKIFEPNGSEAGELELPDLGSASGIQGRWESPEAFFSFTSFHIPTTIYRYDIRKKTRDVWAQLDVPIDSDQFEVKQVWYNSKDGTRVPMFLLHARGIQLDGSNPTFLTGYGGFNISLTPSFRASAVLWAEQGGVFAMPNLRGGGEFGEEWHRAGMRERKQNVFDDFIGAAEWLIEKGYTKPAKLAIAGRSNGGLLVGAAFTQRPELFQAVSCGYPLLDMVRFQKFLIARLWVPEYGSAEDPDEFPYIHAYSPYHQVKPGTEYPAVLFITGDADTRVDPLHARKMAALLQASTTSERPVLIRYDTKLGHSGGQPLSKQIEDLTDELSFLLWQLAVNPKG